MRVIVDDNDSLVQYNFVQVNSHSPDGWIREGKAPEFANTTHASATSGNTAKLTFNGTSISVFGSLAGPSNGRTRWNFDIDGKESGSYDAPPDSPRIQNQHFWTSPDLDANSHTLTITVDQDTSINPNRTIFLDYLVYTPTSAAGKTILCDDSDENILYSPAGWQSLTDSTSFLESTQHVSESAGSWVALTFEGTQISLHGTSSDDFQASVDIDNNSTVLGFARNNQLFNSSVLSSGSHTLNITALNGNSFAIDYFLVTTTLDAPVSTTSTLPSDIPASPNATRPSSDSNLPAGAPLGTQNAGAQNNAPPIAAIVGIAVGGLAFLLLLLVAVLMWRRRIRRMNQPDFDYPQIAAAPSWPMAQTGKRGSVSSMTTLTEGDEERPKNFGKTRPPSRYIYYE